MVYNYKHTFWQRRGVALAWCSGIVPNVTQGTMRDQGSNLRLLHAKYALQLFECILLV